jgi:hypothetical protein
MADPDIKEATKLAYSQLTKHERRVVLGKAALRTLLSVGLLVGIFMAVTPRAVANGEAAFGLLIAVALLAGLIAWELYRTVNDPYPEVRAGTGLVVLITAVVVMFALVYATMSEVNPAAFTAPLTKGDAVYYTVTTLSTTGFGDITAVSPAARWVVTGQMLFDLVLIVGLARVFILAAKAGRARRLQGN